MSSILKILEDWSFVASNIKQKRIRLEEMLLPDDEYLLDLAYKKTQGKYELMEGGRSNLTSDPVYNSVLKLTNNNSEQREKLSEEIIKLSKFRDDVDEAISKIGNQPAELIRLRYGERLTVLQVCDRLRVQEREFYYIRARAILRLMEILEEMWGVALED